MGRSTVGYRFEISVWSHNGRTFGYDVYWVGKSRVKAFRQLRKAKKQYPDCVKLEWR